MFNLNSNLKRGVAGALAVAVLGGGVGGIAAAAGGQGPPGSPASSPPVSSSGAAKQAKGSTLPAGIQRAETAAEDVIKYLEEGKTAKAQAEAATLKGLAHGAAAAELKRVGVPQPKIGAFQQRADLLQQLSTRGAPKLRTSLAANHVSQLMPGFYARYRDPVPPAVLRLDYLDRQIQLRSKVGHAGQVRRLVKSEGTTWAKLRPQLVAAGGMQVASQYDAHLQALKQDKSPAAVQKQALKGLDLVDLMEKAFLGK
jgi:hypothetical protein